LRLAVPNFSALVDVYVKTGKIQAILGPLYGRWVLDTKQGNSGKIYHKTVYDKQSLCELLMQNGFESPREWDWRETDHALIDDHSQAYYPHMEKNLGIHVSLNISVNKK